MQWFIFFFRKNVLSIYSRRITQNLLVTFHLIVPPFQNKKLNTVRI